MSRAALRLAALFLIAAALAPARADVMTDPLFETIYIGATQDKVPITVDFSGSEIVVFGAIARNRFLREGDGEPDVVIVAQGPSEPVVVRKKARWGVLWVNREAIRIAEAPSYYAVASTGPLEDILRVDEDATYKISLNKAVVIAGSPFSAEDPERFRQAVMRLGQEDGLYTIAPTGVTLNGATLFNAKFHLPANIVDGVYKVRIYLLRDGVVRDKAERTVSVFKDGIERTISTAAANAPLLYGLMTLLVALSAGYGASQLFRWLSRR